MDSGMGDKLKGMKDKVVGKIKEEYGELVHDPEKELEGKLQQARGEALEKGEEIKEDISEKIDEVKEDISEKADELADKANDKIDEWKK